MSPVSEKNLSYNLRTPASVDSSHSSWNFKLYFTTSVAFFSRRPFTDQQIDAEQQLQPQRKQFLQETAINICSLTLRDVNLLHAARDHSSSRQIIFIK